MYREYQLAQARGATTLVRFTDAALVWFAMSIAVAIPTAAAQSQPTIAPTLPSAGQPAEQPGSRGLPGSGGLTPAPTDEPSVPTSDSGLTPAPTEEPSVPTSDTPLTPAPTAKPSGEKPLPHTKTDAIAVKAATPRPGPATPQPMFGTFEGTYGLSGISTGFSFGPAGYYIGGELSIVRQFREFTWLGAYVDGVYDFGRDQSRFSIGPEFGWSAIGIDGGYLLAHDSGGTRNGITVRPMLTMGFVTGYARLSHLFGPSSTWLEAGLLLKYPVEF